MNKFNFDIFNNFNDFDDLNDLNNNDSEHHQKNILPWVEKFRPTTLNEIISNKYIVSTLKEYISKQYLPHLLICGPSGTGKTSIINACARELYGDNAGMMTLNINASEERGIEIIRHKVKNFVMTKSIFDNCVNFKLVILDEADAMTISAQGMLRRMIEDFTFNARFCLICNKLKNIDPAIQSRCVLIRFGQLNNIDVYNKLEKICKTEKIKFNKDGLELIIKISKGDMRKVLNNLQSVYMAYKLINYENVSQCLGYPQNNHILEIYKIIKNNIYKDAFISVSKIITDNQYHLLDIINELHDMLIKYIINSNIQDINKFKKIILNLKNVEINCLVSTSENLLISNLVGAFY